MLFRRLTFLVFMLAAAASPARSQTADLALRDHPMPQATDFNIITAIDVSDSVDVYEEELQLTGLSRGVVDPAFLARIAEGQEQRVGFMAYTWSSGGDVHVVVPWTVIAGPADAQRVSALFAAAPRVDRTGFGSYRPFSLEDLTRGMTDIAEAVSTALRLSLAAPFPTRRSVINLLSDGVSNDGSDPRMARDQAIRLGVTINGIVFGGRRDLPDYFRDNIIGGPGAFLMEVAEPGDLPRVLEKKFWQDMIAALPAPPAG